MPLLFAADASLYIGAERIYFFRQEYAIIVAIR